MIRRAFSKEQLKKLFAAIDEPKLGLACLLAVTTGMRRAEVVSTKLSEIQWELNQIHKLKTKGGKPRVYYLDMARMDILRDYVVTLGNTEWLFPAPRKDVEHTTPSGLYSAYRDALRRAGLWANRDGGRYHAYDFHCLRTTFCSLLVRNDVSIFTAAKLMGHSKVSTTERHYADLGERPQIRALEAVFGKHKNRCARSLEISDARQVDREIALGHSVLVEEHRETAPLRDPIHALKLAFADGKLTAEEFKTRVRVLQEV